ncbi:hypothetical protein [Bradyrhizobium sp. 190]|uniref:amino acid kinase family protein n=1 Tax=Bradyrhizobium sp. 190 TaxID=2782658 RepID=UPI0035AB7EA2
MRNHPIIVQEYGGVCLETPAKIRAIRAREELDRGRVVVLAGFQGVNPATREITTLGRGGNDTMAVAMAAPLKAERCEIIKEDDGICSADPRIVLDAKPLRRADRFTGGTGRSQLHSRKVVGKRPC